MSGRNLAIILGRLGRDPELKFSADGLAICNFSMATSKTWKDKNTGEKKEKTEWHRIVAYGQLADVCGKYLQKGREVYIEGRLQTREYEDKGGGAKRYITEIIAEEVTFIGGNSPGGGDQSGGNRPAAPPGTPAQRDGGNFSRPADDDIPF